MDSRWEKKNSEEVVNSKWVKVTKDAVDLPNGTSIDDFYVITIADAACIVALDRDNNIILKREYRYCYDRDLIEIPAGAMEANESDPLACAKRELLEETGYISSTDNWTYLGATIESSSKLTNYMHIYLARDCVKVAEQNLDATEELDVIVMPLSEAVDMVCRNEICCNSSANGILQAARIVGV